jgi:hypothetical protein
VTPQDVSCSFHYPLECSLIFREFIVRPKRRCCCSLGD